MVRGAGGPLKEIRGDELVLHAPEVLVENVSDALMGRPGLAPLAAPGGFRPAPSGAAARTRAGRWSGAQAAR